MNKKMNLIERFYQEVFGVLKRQWKFKKGGTLPHFRGVVCLLAFSLCILALAPSEVEGAFPQQINYQGKLTNAGNIPVSNATYSIVFTIYDASSGGTNKWTETQSVTTESGFFNVILGSSTPIGTDVFDGNDRWLGVKVGADSEMTPRQKLTAVGHAFYAFNADKLDGHDWSEIPGAGDYVAKAGDTMTGTLTNTASASFQAANGSAAAPSYSFTSDPDTGFYKIATGDLRLAIDGVNRSAWDVGGHYTDTIKTLTAVTLTLKGQVADGASAVGATIGNSATLSTAGAKIASFVNNATEKAYIDKDGTFSTGGLVRAVSLESTVATGTAPLTVASTTLVTNFNSDLLDGKHSTDFALTSESGSFVQLGPSSQQDSSATYGAWIKGNTYGLHGEGGTYGVFGVNGSNYGYLGGGIYGVFGRGTVGIWGANASDANKRGYFGGSENGAYGQYNDSNYGYLGGNGYGVYGKGATAAGYFDGSVGIGTPTPGVSLEVAGGVKATNYESTVATGTAPLTVASTTKVTNLNADLLDDHDTSYFATAGSLGNYVLKAGDTMTGTLTNSATASFQAANGSTAVPSYSFTSDTDTGLYYDTNGVVITAAGAKTAEFRYAHMYTDGIYPITSGIPLTLQGFPTDNASAVAFAIGSYTNLTTAGGKLVSIRNNITNEKAYIDKDGTFSTGGLVRAVSLESTVSTGTAPLTVASTTKVTNLNADLLDDHDTSYFATAGSLGNYVLKAGDTMTGTLTTDAVEVPDGKVFNFKMASSQPFTVASTTKVTNLNADLLDDHDSAYFAPASASGAYVQLGPAGQQDSGSTYGAWIKGITYGLHATGGTAVYGSNATSSGYLASGNIGAYGFGTTYGVHGQTNSEGSIGVYGEGLAASSYGVYGSGTAYGVYGTDGVRSGYLGNADYGAYGINGTKYGYLGGVNFAVYGNYGSGAPLGYIGAVDRGVYGATGSSGTYGVYGDTGTTGTYGVYGYSKNASGYGIYGINASTGYGVYGITGTKYGYLGGTSYGGYAEYDSLDKAFLGGSNFGVYGWGTTYAVRGDDDGGNYGYLGGDNYGVYGNGSTAVYGTDGTRIGYLASSNYGAYGQYDANNFGALGRLNIGIYGKGTYGVSAEGSAYGIYGQYNATKYGYIGSINYGVFGTGTTGVYGSGTAGNYGYLGGTYGAYGISGSNYGYLGSTSYGAGGKGTTGVYGENADNTRNGYLGGANYGAYGQSSATRYGYLGGSDNGAYGQYDSSDYGILGCVKGSYGVGVYGKALGSGVSGEGTVAGVWGKGTTSAGVGVYGDYGLDATRFGYLADSLYGVYGQYGTSKPQGYIGSIDYGAYGSYNGTSPYGYMGGASYGAYGNYGATQFGYLGGSAYGAYGRGTTGVYGTDGTRYGYLGSTSYGGYAQYDSNNFAKIAGSNFGVSAEGTATGVFGYTDTGSGVGVKGYAAASAYGVWGETTVTNGWGGYFTGGYGLYTSHLSVGDTSPPVYNNIGTAATSHGLASANDLCITGSLEVNSNIWCDSGAIGTGTALYLTASNQMVKLSSSRKYKKDIADLAVDREKFMALKPVKFNWNEKTGSNGVEDYGLIAEDTEKVAPELAVYSDAGTLESVSYQKVNIMLLKVVQEQQKQIEEMRKELDSIKKVSMAN